MRMVLVAALAALGSCGTPPSPDPGNKSGFTRTIVHIRPDGHWLFCGTNGGGCGADGQCTPAGACCKADDVSACAGRECGSLVNACGHKTDCGLLHGACKDTTRTCTTDGRCCFDVATACGAWQCGSADDGCGHQVSCGTCALKQTCTNHTCARHCPVIKCPIGYYRDPDTCTCEIAE